VSRFAGLIAGGTVLFAVVAFHYRPLSDLGGRRPLSEPERISPHS
jgi:hypothetical protein